MPLLHCRDRVAAMRAGVIVEQLDGADVLKRPRARTAA